MLKRITRGMIYFCDTFLQQFDFTISSLKFVKIAKFKCRESLVIRYKIYDETLLV